MLAATTAAAHSNRESVVSQESEPNFASGVKLIEDDENDRQSLNSATSEQLDRESLGESSSDENIPGPNSAPTDDENSNNNNHNSEQQSGPHTIDDSDYDPEREYLSDPDFHDERPAKKGVAAARELTESPSSDSSSTCGERRPAASLDLAAPNELRLDHSNSRCIERVGDASRQSNARYLESLGEDSQQPEGANEWESDVSSHSSARHREEELIEDYGLSARAEISHNSDEELERTPPPSASREEEQQDQADSGGCSQQDAITLSGQLTVSEARPGSFIDPDETLADEEEAQEEQGDSLREEGCCELADTASFEPEVRPEARRASDDQTLRPVEVETLVVEAKEDIETEKDSEAHEDLGDEAEVDKTQPREKLKDRVDDNTTGSGGHLLNGPDSRKRRLMELIEDYCDKLVELVKEEAFKQVELILASPSSQMGHEQEGSHVEQLSLSNTFESNCSTIAVGGGDNSNDDQVPADEQQVLKTRCRRIYTSSLFYDDKRNSYPTIEEQLDRCQTIVKQLELGRAAHDDDDDDDDIEIGERSNGAQTEEAAAGPRESPSSAVSGQFERASSMFRRRRERMRHYTIGSSYADATGVEQQPSTRRTKSSSSLFGQLNQSRGGASERERTSSMCSSQKDATGSDQDERPRALSLALTDTEYEAPQVARWAKLVGSQSDVIGEDSNEGPLRPKYRPFLDSTTLKDIERLREWCPELEFNEHRNVLPETCQKLVDDLKAGGSCRPGEQKRPSRGALLFERRQLQSSDWIVSAAADEQPPTGHGGSPPLGAPNSIDLSSSDGKAAAGGNTAATPTEGAVVQRSAEQRNKTTTSNTLLASDQSSRLSRPSIGEETVMVVENACQEQLIEEAPVVLDHQQPHLELATITRTASFGTSSRRIVDCNSPDGHDHLSDSSSSSPQIDQSSNESIYDDSDAGRRAREDRSPPAAGEPHDVHDDELGVDEQLLASRPSGQPLIQLNDRDLLEAAATSGSQWSGERLRASESHQAVVRLAEDETIASDDSADVTIAHEAVVKRAPEEGEHHFAQFRKRLSAGKLQHCIIESLPDWPRVQFASMQNYHQVQSIGGQQVVVGGRLQTATRWDDAGTGTSAHLCGSAQEEASFGESGPVIDGRVATRTIGEYCV